MTTTLIAPPAPPRSTGAPPAGGLLVNVGCGRQPLPGFLNVDLAPPCDRVVDARKRLPFADRSVAGIYSEHLLEHLTQRDGMRFLRECRRVLQWGGRLRLAMPDLAELLGRYGLDDWRAGGDMFELGYDWVQNRCEMINLAMREWGHRWVYDEEELTRLGRLAGLDVVGRLPRGDSDWPAFRGIESRPGSRLVMEFERRMPPDATGTPLVSILIPAYNPRFFAAALRSAQAQTYPSLEIIVCDDDRSGGIGALVRDAGPDARVCYIRNEPARGGLLNYAQCLSVAHGEFVKFLNDDDLLAPDCVARMVDGLQRCPDVRLVTSSRRRIDEHGTELRVVPASRPLARRDCVIEGRSLAHAMVRARRNRIGEPTTAMFRRRDLEFVTPHLMSFGGATTVGVGDVAMWLNLLSQGDLLWLNEPLSSFRVHAEQRQRDPEVMRAARTSWQLLAFHARRLGLRQRGPGIWVLARGVAERRWRQHGVATLGELRRRATAFVRAVCARLRRLSAR